MKTTERVALYQQLINEVFDLNKEQITNPEAGLPVWKTMQDIKELLKITQLDIDPDIYHWGSAHPHKEGGNN